ncbi:MAG: leucine-rich repeat domain-containing protein [Bacteroidota bacterium]
MILKIMKQVGLCLTLLTCIHCSDMPKNSETTAEMDQSHKDMTSSNSKCSTLELFDSKFPFRSSILEEFARTAMNGDLDALLLIKEDVTKLDLSDASLNALPKTLREFPNLKYLDISGNRFTDKEKLFEELSLLPSLRILRLNSSNLKTLPSNVRLLQDLEVLDVSRANLQSIENIGDLEKLKLLSVRGNSQLKDLPASIAKLKCLQSLDVSASGMERLRDELAACTQLVNITANASRIASIPMDIGDLKQLRHLNLAANRIELVPTSIGGLQELQDLHLGSNELKGLPEEFKRLENLEFISLDYNRFKEFPSQVLTLHHVHNLWVHNNSFKEIPTEVAQMQGLTHLLIDHEIITDENIEEIKRLNPELRVIRQDSRRYVKGRKRKN